MAGYDKEKHMSRNAVEAYDKGRMPISKWTKTTVMGRIQKAYPKSAEAFGKMTLAFLREHFLVNTEWHHTSDYFNATDFYTFNAFLSPDELEAITAEWKRRTEAKRLAVKYKRQLSDENYRVTIETATGQKIENCVLTQTKDGNLLALSADDAFHRWEEKTADYRATIAKDPGLFRVMHSGDYVRLFGYWIPKTVVGKKIPMTFTKFEELVIMRLPPWSTILRAPSGRNPQWMEWTGDEWRVLSDIDPFVFDVLSHDMPRFTVRAYADYTKAYTDFKVKRSYKTKRYPSEI